MSTYMTETEQVELLKAWWKRYNHYILVGLSVILLSASGIRYWQWHQQKVNEQASTAYEHMMLSFSNHNNKAVRSYAHTLIESYPKTVYADTARLMQAKLEVSAGHYDNAIAALTTVAEHSKFKILVDVAHLRLARILTYQKSFNKAMLALDKISDSTYDIVKSELRGDIYYAQGQLQQALTEYQTAKSGIEKTGVGNLFLDMKQHDVLAAIKTSPTVQAS